MSNKLSLTTRLDKARLEPCSNYTLSLKATDTNFCHFSSLVATRANCANNAVLHCKTVFKLTPEIVCWPDAPRRSKATSNAKVELLQKR
jgi:hypothetical protein